MVGNSQVHVASVIGSLRINLENWLMDYIPQAGRDFEGYQACSESRLSFLSLMAGRENKVRTLEIEIAQEVGTTAQRTYYYTVPLLQVPQSHSEIQVPSICCSVPPKTWYASASSKVNYCHIIWYPDSKLNRSDWRRTGSKFSGPDPQVRNIYFCSSSVCTWSHLDTRAARKLQSLPGLS